MRVCCLIAGNMIGGGVKMMVRLASHLSEQHEVTLIYPTVPYYTLFHRLKKTFWSSKIRHILVERFRHKSKFFFEADLDKRVSIKRYFLLPSARKLNQFDAIIYPSVWQYHELQGLYLNGIRKIHWALADHVFTNAVDTPIDILEKSYLSDDILVAPSQATLNDFQSYGFKPKTVIHGGIDSIFNAKGRSWKSENPSILGYLQPGWWVKGGATLVQCLRQLRSRYPSLRIDLFGHQKSDTIQSGSPLCDRFYTGLSSSEVAKLYRAHDIFVYPSYTDGFPSPPLEAMACGCTVVTTRVGAVPEYARHEESALLCDPMDHQGLFDQTKRLLADPALRFRLSNNAIEEAKRWTWSECARKFDLLLQSQKD